MLHLGNMSASCVKCSIQIVCCQVELESILLATKPQLLSKLSVVV